MPSPVSILEYLDSTAYEGKEIGISCTSSTLSICTSEKDVLEIPFFDIFNIELIKNASTQNIIRIHYYPYESHCISKSRTYQFYDIFLDQDKEPNLFNETENIVNKLLKMTLERDIKYNEIKRKILLVINPVSGTGHTMQLFMNEIKSLFDKARLDYDIIQSEYAQHMIKYAREDFDKAKYNEIIYCGGDGIVHEFLNGLMQRSDYKEICRTIPMGSLMGGSGCAVACTICTINDLPYELSNSVLYCLKGKYKSKDLIKCTINDKNNTIYANCQLYWGIASNILTRGNRFRCLGKIRFIIQALLEIVTKEMHEGVLSYLPEEEEEEEFGLDKNGHYCPKLEDKVPDNWVKVKGKFIGAIIVICSNFNQEMKIDNKMDINTGRICILYAKELNRLKLLYMFSKIIDRKSDVSDLTRFKDVCDVIYTKAFRLEHNGSCLMVDGEDYGTNGVVQCEIIEGKLNWLTF